MRTKDIHYYLTRLENDAIATGSQPRPLMMESFRDDKGYFDRRSPARIASICSVNHRPTAKWKRYAGQDTL
jgi:hypothetical protein